MAAVAQRGHPGTRAGTSWAGPRERPRLRVVDAPRHARRWTILLVIAGAAGVFAVVGLNALAAESAFTARNLERELDDLTLRYEELTAEVAALEAPERIRAVALTELGMIPATHPTFLEAERTFSGDRLSESLAGPRVSQSPTPVLAIGR